MSKNFEFDAPQFVNFSDLDDPEADRFFDIRYQKLEEKRKSVSKLTTKPNKNSFEQSNTENKDSENNLKGANSCNKGKNNLSRKILQEIANQQSQNEDTPFKMSNKHYDEDIIRNFEKLQLSETKLKKVKRPLIASEVFSESKLRSGRKSHHMVTRLDVLIQRSEKKSDNPEIISQESIECDINSKNTAVSLFSEEKVVKMKRKASPICNSRKFISLAEQIQHFYYDTPDRFKSKPTKNSVLNNQSWNKNLHACIPRTPKLTSKFRQRKVNFPNEKEREDMELEEIKKHQIKAYPLNEKVLKGPSLNLKNPVFKKATTIPQPFSLTEIKKKVQPQEPVFHFKAQPIPANILKGPVGIPPKKIASPTVPSTPQIRVPLRYKVGVKTPEKTVSTESLNQHRNTKVEPFSFDARMKESIQKKENYIKKVIEEEKKTFNSFKALPMPSFNTKHDISQKSKTPLRTIPQPFHLTQVKKDKTISELEANDSRVSSFKARPATVIHQKPFVPVLPKHETVFPLGFHLKTEERAIQRSKFDEKIKEKEEALATILKKQKEEMERIEKEKALEERKKAEFKANPMPRYKAFEIHPADPEQLTLPESPKFSSRTTSSKTQIL